MSKSSDICRLVRAGLNANQIAAALNADPQYVRRVARLNGIALKRPPSERAIDITGQQFGHLTAISRPPEKQDRWICKCSCGGEKIVRTYALRAGTVRSCGCRYQTGEQCFKHGMSKHRLYFVWVGMRERCHNPQNKSFERYGARGISVCSRWRDSFVNFYADMGPRPSDGHSIDRYPDNDGNYEPGNCRWATAAEQANNKRPRRKAA